MIQKVENTAPNSLGDIDLPHQAPARSGKQKSGGAAEASADAEDPDGGDEKHETRPPLRPRHLGIRLDLIA